MTDVQDWHDTDIIHAEQGQGDPFAAAVRATRMPMIVTDPRRADNPIVFANAAFLRLTGYAHEEVLGRNCRFLQGRDTDPASIRAIREAVEAKRDISLDILNYHKDGTPFWNALYLSPVTTASGELQFFFASQMDITDRVEVQLYLTEQRALLEREVTRRTKDLQAALAAKEEALAIKTMLVHEVDHRVKNNLQMIASMLAMQARTVKNSAAGEMLAGVLQRIENIGTVHRRLYQSEDVRRFDLSEFVRDVFDETARGTGRDNIHISYDVEPVSVASAQASPLALMLNEILINALKHAFPDGRAFEPDIEVWDLDVVDRMFPNAILGQGGEGASNVQDDLKRKKKKKKPKVNDEFHVDAVLALAANRQHRNLLASSSADKTVKLWDLNTTKCAKSYSHYTDKVCALDWHPKESTVLLSGSYDRTVVAADMRAPEAAVPRWKVESDVETVRWDPHDSNFFYVTTEQGMVHFFDLRIAQTSPDTSKPVWVLQAHDSNVSSFDVNPIIPGFLVTGSMDKQVKLWNVQPSGPSMVVSRKLSVGKVFSTQFGPDPEVGFRLAVAGSKGAVQVWDTSTNAGVRRAFANRVALPAGDVKEKVVGIGADSSDSEDDEDDVGDRAGEGDEMERD